MYEEKLVPFHMLVSCFESIQLSGVPVQFLFNSHGDLALFYYHFTQSGKYNYPSTEKQENEVHCGQFSHLGYCSIR